MNKELLQDLNAVYNGLNEDLDESKILLGNIIDKLEQAINYTPCCDKLKDIEILTFDAWVNKYYRIVLNGYSDHKTEEFKTEKELLKIYEDIEQNL